jgi:RTX calcium-binding nonapeptide repeat (4 copies)
MTMRGKYLTSFGLLTAGVTVAAMAANVYGTAGNDNPLMGTRDADKMYGYAGHDHMYGVDGNDILYGGDGNDLLNGGVGSNWLNGGAGDDTFDTQLATYTTTIDGYQGHEVVHIDCSSDWDGQPGTSNLQKLVLQNRDANADMVFTGRDGIKILFKGLTKNDMSPLLAPNIQRRGLAC